jgi:hypothetical protein
MPSQMPFFDEGQDPLDEPRREPTAQELYVQWLRSELQKIVTQLDEDPDGKAARNPG